MPSARELVERLAKAEEQISTIRSAQERKRAALLKPIAARLQDIDTEADRRAVGYMEQAKKIEAELRDKVADAAERMTYQHPNGIVYDCVYVGPKVTWDAKMLEGLAAAYPAVATAKKVADRGTVQIRRSAAE